MLPVSKKKASIGYGELFEMAYGIDPDGRAETIIGRVWGKLTPGYSGGLFKSRQAYYVFKPDSSHPDAELKARDELLKLMLAMIGKAELEWGQLPPGTWLAAPEAALVPIVSPMMAIRFKQNGLCPKCGDKGVWKSLGLVCPWHGKFMG